MIRFDKLTDVKENSMTNECSVLLVEGFIFGFKVNMYTDVYDNHEHAQRAYKQGFYNVLVGKDFKYQFINENQFIFKKFYGILRYTVSIQDKQIMK